jgi:hypothetical protein
VPLLCVALQLFPELMSVGIFRTDPRAVGMFVRVLAGWTLTFAFLRTLCAFDLRNKNLFISSFASFVLFAGWAWAEGPYTRAHTSLSLSPSMPSADCL